MRYDPVAGIDVDETMRTSNPNIYAVGDVTGEYMLVHVAIYQGEVAARNACLALGEKADYRVVAAHTVFCDPQVAAVGASEKELQRREIPYVSGRYDFAEHGKAQCLAKTKGFVKMMADRETGRILGAAIIGPQASELIHEVIVAMKYRSDGRAVHAHPASPSDAGRDLDVPGRRVRGAVGLASAPVTSRSNWRRASAVSEPRDRLRVAIVQMKPAKGQYGANLRSAGEAFAQLCSDPPDLIVLPEAALTGYFLEGAVYDLALPAERFAADLATAWRDACPRQSVDIVCGFYENDAGTYYNSALYLHVEPQRERIVHVHRKMFLPTYGVFDEERFLSRGRKLGVFETPFGTMALLVCEDAWHAITPTIAAVKGARIIIVPSASPGRGIEAAGELASVTQWRDTLRLAAIEHGVFVIYAGLTGFEGGKGMSGSSSRHRSARSSARRGAAVRSLHPSRRSRPARNRCRARHVAVARRLGWRTARPLARRRASVAARTGSRRERCLESSSRPRIAVSRPASTPRLPPTGWSPSCATR